MLLSRYRLNRIAVFNILECIDSKGLSYYPAGIVVYGILYTVLLRAVKMLLKVFIDLCGS